MVQMQRCRKSGLSIQVTDGSNNAQNLLRSAAPQQPHVQLKRFIFIGLAFLLVDVNLLNTPNLRIYLVIQKTICFASAPQVRFEY